jgi:hypothetical protein
MEVVSLLQDLRNPDDLGITMGVTHGGVVDDPKVRAID